MFSRTGKTRNRGSQFSGCAPENVRRRPEGFSSREALIPSTVDNRQAKPCTAGVGRKLSLVKIFSAPGSKGA